LLAQCATTSLSHVLWSSILSHDSAAT
jgi:hypothetical protein